MQEAFSVLKIGSAAVELVIATNYEFLGVWEFFCFFFFFSKNFSAISTVEFFF